MRSHGMAILPVVLVVTAGIDSHSAGGAINSPRHARKLIDAWNLPTFYLACAILGSSAKTMTLAVILIGLVPRSKHAPRNDP